MSYEIMFFGGMGVSTALFISIIVKVSGFEKKSKKMLKKIMDDM